MEDGYSGYRRVEGQSEETRVVEFVLEQDALPETWCAVDEPRGAMRALGCPRLGLNLMFGRQYAVMAEVLGRGGHMASQAVNCSAPDTGNMGA